MQDLNAVLCSICSHAPADVMHAAAEAYASDYVQHGQPAAMLCEEGPWGR